MLAEWKGDLSTLAIVWGKVILLLSRVRTTRYPSNTQFTGWRTRGHADVQLVERVPECHPLG
ncbi:hypothetical protein AUI46_08185 [archaeon 13_1_40CM_2_52_13]|nr:MAG: hypothetical protein AUI46_08185 [archaeon 13_1_40CM_2_52_13]